MKTFSKRLLTMVLAVAMVFSLSGMTTFAAESDESDAQDVSAEAQTLSETGDEVMPLADSDSYDTKYAVCIWGIEQDVDVDGNTLGLTFGPATGANYINSYVSKESVKAAGGTHESDLCIHDMSWSEIIEQSKTDPTVFQSCLENGCTKSVDISLNSSLLSKSYEGQLDNGDGAGMIRDSIKDTYRYWNEEESNTGGWPASRIRATLNGTDEYTDSTVAGEDTLSAGESLLSCFPEDLQSGIVAKAVKSDTVYGDTSGNNTTTDDKLWLFSCEEIYGSGSGNHVVVRPNEGERYQKSENMNWTLTEESISGLVAYNEVGTAYDWWLRSMPTSARQACYISGTAGIDMDYVDDDHAGLSPGFCLAGPEASTSDADKTALQAEYDADCKLVEDDYTADSWEVFKTALDAAEAVLANNDASQDDVDDALATLVAARESLEQENFYATYDWYTENTGDTYTLHTANDLIGLSNIVNGTAVEEGIPQDTFKDKTVNLVNSIKLNKDNVVEWTYSFAGGDEAYGTVVTTEVKHDGAYAFTPIGNSDSNVFLGTFNGGDNTISNLYVEGGSYLGLFGNVGKTDTPGEDGYGTIEHFTVEGVINGTGGEDDNYIAGVCGKLNAGGRIEYVINKADVEAPNTYNIGGIVGFAGTKYDVESYPDNPSGYNTYVYCCGNEGAVHGYDKTGGIVGELAATVKYCYNTGWVFVRESGSKSSYGGIAGRNGNNNTATEQSVIAYCYNTGMISNGGYPDGQSGTSQSRRYAGIAGWALGANGENEIYNCYNRGAIPVGYNSGYNSICAGPEGAATVAIRNNYSLDDSTLIHLGDDNEVEAGIPVEESDFKVTGYGDDDILTKLGPYFVASPSDEVNDGFPILWWQDENASEPPTEVDEVKLSGEPGQTTYSLNDLFNPDGLKVYVSYKDSDVRALVLPEYGIYTNGSTKTRIPLSEGFSCTPETLGSSGSQTVTISYDGKTAGTTTVTVGS